MIVAVARADLGYVVMFAGALLILIAAIGTLRFPDSLTRMHALSKASTLGVTLALIGAAVAMTRLDDVMSLVFAAGLLGFTNPVASTLLARSTYYANEPGSGGESVADETSDADARHADAGGADAGGDPSAAPAAVSEPTVDDAGATSG